jgi:hypothetical protein
MESYPENLTRQENKRRNKPLCCLVPQTYAFFQSFRVSGRAFVFAKAEVVPSDSTLGQSSAAPLASRDRIYHE